MRRQDFDGVVKQLEDLQARIADLRSQLLAKLDVQEKPVASDRLIAVKEAAKRLGVQPQWLYRRSRELPFMMKISTRAFRVSERGLEKWMKVTAR